MSPKVRRLVKLLSRLPGVGEKTAQRYVLCLLTADDALSRELGARARIAARRARARASAAATSPRSSDGRALCDVCGDGKRDAKVLCVVARVHDLMAIERAGSMRGRYFVLGRLLSPLEGIGPGRPAHREAGRAHPERRRHARSSSRRRRASTAKRRRSCSSASSRRSASRSRGSRAASRTAATSSSPTPSRWVAPSRAAARCRLGAHHDQQPIATKDAPAAIGPYSQAMRAGGLVFLSGQIPLDPATGQIVPGDIAAQTERVLKNLEGDPRAPAAAVRRRRAHDDLPRRPRALRDGQRGVRAVLRRRPPCARHRAGLGAAPRRARRDRRDRYGPRLSSRVPTPRASDGRPRPPRRGTRGGGRARPDPGRRLPIDASVDADDGQAPRGCST